MAVRVHLAIFRSAVGNPPHRLKAFATGCFESASSLRMTNYLRQISNCFGKRERIRQPVFVTRTTSSRRVPPTPG